MLKAGEFNEAFIWLKQVLVKSENSGSDIEMFANNGILWGSMESTTASESEAFGALRSQASATVTFRQYPKIEAVDRLYHKRFGEVYVIDGKRRTKNETVCDVTKYDGVTLMVVQIVPDGGARPGGSATNEHIIPPYLLTEDGFALVTEDGDFIRLE